MRLILLHHFIILIGMTWDLLRGFNSKFFYIILLLRYTSFHIYLKF